MGKYTKIHKKIFLVVCENIQNTQSFLWTLQEKSCKKRNRFYGYLTKANKIFKIGTMGQFAVTRNVCRYLERLPLPGTFAVTRKNLVDL